MDKSNVYITADLHLGHRKAAEMRGFDSVEAHDQQIIDNLNSVLSKDTVLWVLGDIVFGPENFNKLSEIRGIKKAVLGNHDGYMTSYYDRRFNKVLGATQLKSAVLTHIPVHPSQLGSRYRFNIHGHLHNKSLTMDDPRYFCVSLEQNELMPFRLDVVINLLKYWEENGFDPFVGAITGRT